MRKSKAYTIYDQVSEVYSEWMFKAQNGNDAMRAFQGLLSKGDVRPQDVILYEIGEYDRISGKVKGYDIPKLVISGIDLTRKEAVEDE